MLLPAQDLITPGQFAFRVDSDLVYGVDTNYAGHLDTLALDLYKPLGDPDDARPLLVLVHGGAWEFGCKNETGSAMVALAREMVQRGYVVASVDYRLGWHKAAFVPAPAGPPAWPEVTRSYYAADTLELIRANYRGMQDVKGAIRWLKARAGQDSVCTQRVVVGGESAGGFIALATGFMDRAEERPAACGAIADAPWPDASLANTTGLACRERTIEIDNASLHRPDLGPVEGDLNLNGEDARTAAVLSFIGGVFAGSMPPDQWAGPDAPAVYLHHQTCDGIVPSGPGQLMFVPSHYCNPGYSPWHTNYPVSYGSSSILAAFATMPSAPTYHADLVDCAAFDPDQPEAECARYQNSGYYHYTVDPAARAVEVAAFLEPLLSGRPCDMATGLGPDARQQLMLAPNPAATDVHLWGAPAGPLQLDVLDARGALLRSQALNASGGAVRLALDPAWPPGPYVVRIRANDRLLVARLAIVR